MRNKLILRVVFGGVFSVSLLFHNTPGYSYYAESNKIYSDNGTEIGLFGVNWFGFETGNHAVHGLWERNLKEMITQMGDLGFNAVRLPFCPASLTDSTIPSGIDSSLNPDLVGLGALSLLDVIVAEFDRQGIYIVLDHHRPDCEAISELWHTSSYTEENWLSDLSFVADRYKGISHFLGIDLKNEPHGAALWGNGDPATDWKMAAEEAMEAVYFANPNILVFVEGTEIVDTCGEKSWDWWGGNLRGASCYPIANPNKNLIYSPHAYGPDVYWQDEFSYSSFPENMPEQWDGQFGFLPAQGGTVVIGEWGGRYGTGGGYAEDVLLQDAFVDYLINKEIFSNFWWSWNPNSGDTGGILQDDWLTPWDSKLALVGRLQTGWETLQSQTIDSVHLSPASVALVEGTTTDVNTVCLSPSASEIDCGAVTWTSSLARTTINSSGLVTALSPLPVKGCTPLTSAGPGKKQKWANYSCKMSGTVTATLANGMTAQAPLALYSDEAVAVDIVVPEAITVGGNYTLSAICTAESGTVEVPCGGLAWSGTGIITDGMFTPTTAGEVTVTVARTAYSTAKDTVILMVAEVTDAGGNLVLAFVGDYGEAGVDEEAVASLIKSWNPDYVITLGDNNYFSGTLAGYPDQASFDSAAYASYDQNVGAYFGDYMSLKLFYPVMGNHEIDIDNGGGRPVGYYYEDYFSEVVPLTSSGNRRYYDVDLGGMNLVHLFVISSDYREPNGRDSGSLQAGWIKNQMESSPSMFNLVLMHHPPYSSGEHGSNSTMQWPYPDWGGDIVLAGHDHDYERLDKGGFAYIVNGTGGKSLRSFITIDPDSLVRINDVYGALRAKLDQAAQTMTFEYITVDGVVMDTYVLPARVHDKKMNLVGMETVWSYLDTGVDPGTGWTDSSFNDSSWKTGLAPLGYGDTVTTTVSYGSDSTSKYITTYFRTTFDADDPSVWDELSLQVQRDDGIVVYLNGTEVLRNNMPTGSVSYTTKATTALSGSSETEWISSALSPSVVYSGTNNAAVEIHQASSSSSDIFMNMTLQAVDR